MIYKYVLYYHETGIIKNTSTIPFELTPADIENGLSTLVLDNDINSMNDFKVIDGRLIESENAILQYTRMKLNRAATVANLEVTYNEVVYQADETSQDRMSRTINGLPDEVSAVPWVAKDNSIQYLTKSDLRQILYLAVQEQSRLWSEDRLLLKE